MPEVVEKVRFVKNEIVWAKMRGHACWPAKLIDDLEITTDFYKPKVPLQPQIMIIFISGAVSKEFGSVHPNHIYKFVENYKKF